jgi:cellulose synthase operon protein C
MEFHARQIAAPKYWEEFEDLCLDLFRLILADPTAQKNGRRGQPQHGTDIWGTPRYQGDELHGVQCKGKDAGLGAEVTETELRNEVDKAKNFTPKLAHWILATTAPKDAKIEALARDITAEHQRSGLFAVQVLGWEDLQSLISNHDTVMEKYYPDQAPTRHRIEAHLGQLVEQGDTRDLQFQSIQSGLDILLARLPTELSASAPVDREDIGIQAQIDQARDLLRDAQPKTALKILDRVTESSWDRATPRARFRLISNRASALLQLCETEAAASLFIEAIDYAPNDPKAKLNAALAHLLRDEWEAARAIANGLLADDPANADAAGLRIIAAFDEPDIQDPLSLVQPANHSAGNVLLAAARWYRHHGDPASCLDKLERAYSAQPEDLDIKAELATAILDSIFQDSVATYGRKMTGSQRQDFARAAAMLSEVWEKARKGEAARRFAITAANLSTALRFTQRIDEAGRVIDEALTSAPDEPILVKQKAHVLWARGRFPQVLATLEGLCAKEDLDVLVMRIEALTALGCHPEALLALEQLPQTDDPKIRRVVNGSRIRMLWLNGRHADAVTTAKRLVLDCPDDPISYITLADVYSRSGDSERAREVARNGLEHTASDDGLHRLMLGDALYALGDWDGAVSAVGPITGIEEDSHALRLRINALMRANRRQEATQLLSSLPPAIADLPAYQGAAAGMSWQTGDYPAARQHLDRYLARTPSDLRMRLLWLQVVEKLGDEEASARFLTSEFSFHDAEPRELLALAQVLDRHGYGERALRLGYRVLRDRWTDPQAHLGYTGLCLIGRSARDAIPRPSAIELDAAFTVQDGPDRKHTYIIEAELPPDLSRGEIPPDSPLVSEPSDITWVRRSE